MPEIIKVLVTGGQVTPGPPLGPALGPMGINAKAVVDEINKKTSNYAGMKVPVKVIVDPSTKKFEVEVGTPPASALIKKELGIEKGAKDANIVGNLTLEQLLKIVDMKKHQTMAKTLKNAVKEIAGTCLSMGVQIEGMNARDFIKAVNEGKFDDKLNKINF